MRSAPPQRARAHGRPYSGPILPGVRCSNRLRLTHQHGRETARHFTETKVSYLARYDLMPRDYVGRLQFGLLRPVADV